MQLNLTLKIKVKPADKPDSIEVDISELIGGETLLQEKVRDKIPFEVLSNITGIVSRKSGFRM